jgi:hypothetical protein
VRGRASLLAVAALCLLGVAAPTAAGWGELAVHDVGYGQVATCLRATDDSRLQLLQPTSRERWAFDLLASGPMGLTPIGHPYLPGADVCPTIASIGDVTVAASESYVDRRRRRRTVVEAAVSHSGVSRRLPLGQSRGDSDLATAASARGDAVIGWRQTRALGPRREERRAVVRRVSADGRLGPLEPLTRWRHDWDDPLVAVGMDATATATVVWTRHQSDGSTAVSVARGKPGEPLSPKETIARDVASVETLALSVSPSGRALVSFDGGGRVRVRERMTADGPFAPVRVPGLRGDPRTNRIARRFLRDGPTTPALALRDDGGAVLAWRDTTNLFGDGDARVAFSTRAPGAGFARARTFGPEPGQESDSSVSLLFAHGGPPVDDGDQRTPRVALGPGGRFALGWMREQRTPFGDRPVVAKAVLGSLDGALGSPTTISCECRSVDAVAVVIANGEPTVAYTDNVSGGLWPRGEFPAGTGRLHLWASSSDAVERPPPTFALSAPRIQRPRWRDPLVVHLRCSAACDARGSIKRKRLRALGTASLAKAGRVRLRLWPTSARPVLPAGARRVRVGVRVAARNGQQLALRRLWVSAQRRPRPPLPRFVDARVVRRGERAVVVSWRYPARPKDVFFLASGELRRRGADMPERLVRFRKQRAEQRYRVVLRPRPRDHLRGIKLTAYQFQSARIRTLVLPLP